MRVWELESARSGRTWGSEPVTSHPFCRPHTPARTRTPARSREKGCEVPTIPAPKRRPMSEMSVIPNSRNTIETTLTNGMT